MLYNLIVSLSPHDVEEMLKSLVVSTVSKFLESKSSHVKTILEFPLDFLLIKVPTSAALCLTPNPKRILPAPFITGIKPEVRPNTCSASHPNTSPAGLTMPDANRNPRISHKYLLVESAQTSKQGVCVECHQLNTSALTAQFLHQNQTPDTAREILKNSAGIVVIDDRASNNFPTPLEVLLGRCLVGISGQVGAYIFEWVYIGLVDACVPGWRVCTPDYASTPSAL
ncbi:hypothetical protein ACLOJK_027963 [Asimina triloba]